MNGQLNGLPTKVPMMAAGTLARSASASTTARIGLHAQQRRYRDEGAECAAERDLVRAGAQVDEAATGVRANSVPTANAEAATCTAKRLWLVPTRVNRHALQQLRFRPLAMSVPRLTRF